MSRTKALQLALAVTVSWQAAFLADYYRITDGCFCAVLRAGGPMHRIFPGELPFLRVASLPVRAIPWSLPIWIDDPSQTIVYVLFNTLAWFSVFAAVIQFTNRMRRSHDRVGSSPSASTHAG